MAKRLLSFAGLIVFLVVCVPFSIRGEPSSVPSLEESLRRLPAIDFCGEPVPLDDTAIRERMEKEMLLSLWDRDQAVLWLKRSRRYFPLIEKMLAQAGLPDDLKFVSLAESALRPHAGSPKGAIGFWQFLPETGRRYGLTVSDAIDQRRNLAASTKAAIAYYGDLYERFGSWSLAVTAFNMGEEGLEAEILAQGVRDFYRLYLPLETQRYLFRILSAKLILTQPEQFGFFLKDSEYYQPLQFASIELTCFEETSLSVVARAAKTDFKRIKDLNPELRGHYLEAGTYTLAIPVDGAAGFQERFDKLHAEWVSKRKERVYVVQPGDNLSSIAEQFRVPLPAILIWNRLDVSRHIHPGDRLVIYPLEEKSDGP